MTYYYSVYKIATDRCNNMDKPQKHDEWKKPYIKKYILYDYIYMKSWYKSQQIS